MARLAVPYACLTPKTRPCHAFSAGQTPRLASAEQRPLSAWCRGGGDCSAGGLVPEALLSFPAGVLVWVLGPKGLSLCLV